MTEKITYAFLSFWVIVLCLIVGWQAINTNEQNECRQWQSNSHELINFYITASEAEQCHFWKIPVDAKIK